MSSRHHGGVPVGGFRAAGGDAKFGGVRMNKLLSLFIVYFYNNNCPFKQAGRQSQNKSAIPKPYRRRSRTHKKLFAAFSGDRCAQEVPSSP